MESAEVVGDDPVVSGQSRREDSPTSSPPLGAGVVRLAASVKGRASPVTIGAMVTVVRLERAAMANDG